MAFMISSFETVEHVDDIRLSYQTKVKDGSKFNQCIKLSISFFKNDSFIPLN